MSRLLWCSNSCVLAWIGKNYCCLAKQQGKERIGGTNEKIFAAGAVAICLSSGVATAQVSGGLGGVAAANTPCLLLSTFFNPRDSLGGEILTTAVLNEGAAITLTATSIEADSGASNGAFYFVDASGARLGSTYVYPLPSGPVSETFIVPTGGITGFGWAEDSALGGASTELRDLDLSCVVDAPSTPSSASSLVPNVAEISAASQRRAVNDALSRNIRGRFSGGGENFASRDNVFLSTQNAPGNRGASMEYNAWISLSGRYYWDGLEGHSVDFLFGLDRLLSQETMLGIMFGTGFTDLKAPGGGDASTDSYLFGVYGAHSYQSGLMTQGHIGYSLVNYDATGIAGFNTDRYLLGFEVSGETTTRVGVLQPRLRIDASWEDFPDGIANVAGGYSRQIVTTLGARHEWSQPIAGTSLMPYASFDFEFAQIDDTSGTAGDYVAPRLGIGMAGYIGSGQFSAGIDLGQSTADVYDAGIELNYEFRF